MTEKPAVLGKMTWSQWLAGTGWEIPPAGRPLPEDKINRLGALTERHNIRFAVFASTECGECKDYLPPLFRIFEAARIDNDRIELYGLDGELREPGGIHLKYDIPATPCVFLSSSDKVVGLLAYPDFKWLDGMLDILGKL